MTRPNDAHTPTPSQHNAAQGQPTPSQRANNNNARCANHKHRRANGTNVMTSPLPIGEWFRGASQWEKQLGEQQNVSQEIAETAPQPPT